MVFCFHHENQKVSKYNYVQWDLLTNQKIVQLGGRRNDEQVIENYSQPKEKKFHQSFPF